ncbi:MAG: trigger factor [Actinomycetota bacterium]|nr:trigger factor [Actinomycetota bacterium]
MHAQVEELADNRVRLEVEVPREDVKHAIEHATADLAQALKIPGFRKGRVPRPVLLARLGRERVYAEAVESHISGWFRNAAVRTGIRPVAQPEYGYELPASEDESFRFTATVAVQPKPNVADWTELEVPEPPVDVSDELIDGALEEVRESVAELVPVDGRPSQEGDTLVVDLVGPDEVQRDYVVELGSGRLLPEVEAGLIGLSAGETKEIEYHLPDDRPRTVRATVKEIKEKVLPPLDDELARAASEFETLAELRADLDSRLREQLERDAEGEFRAAVADALVEASEVEASGLLVDARASELGAALARSLQRRGISLETYLQLAGEGAEQLRERLVAEAWQSVARELVLEAVADRLEIAVADEDIDAFVREEAEAAGEDADEAIAALRRNGRYEQLRDELRLRRALDRVAAEVKRISPDLAAAREKLWTPEQEKTQADTTLWTPGTKESA